MPFVADDLGAWLVGLLADAGRKKLTAWVLGTDQERTLRSATTAAVRLTAEELRPDNDEQAEQVALVVNQVFSEPVPAVLPAGHTTMLEGLQAAIAERLAVLEDAGLTGTGQSSADVLDTPSAVVAELLTANLLREIVTRGAHGGPLFPLASQLNDDVTHLQGRRLEDMVARLAGDLQEALARLDRQAARKAAGAVARPSEVAGHVFISYIREDSRHVDLLQQALEEAGVRVWRDTQDLWPGEDWRLKIRRAITDNAIVFIVCFSSRSLARSRSYQNEELLLAIEQLRLRPLEEPWLIPVRFDDCEIPERDIGGGRTLTSIQRADLFDDHFAEGVARVLTTVLRILGRLDNKEASAGQSHSDDGRVVLIEASCDVSNG
jgi:TIR domain